MFSQEIWARRAWLSRAADLPGGEAVFSAAAVDELLSMRGLRTPFLRMAKDGTVIASSRFTGSGGVGATIADQVRDDDVLRLFADGATVVLQGLHRTWAPVGDLAARLTEELGHPVQVNAYITPPQSQGFAPHYDTHDVFVMQVAGAKHWLVHDPVIDLPDVAWETIGDEVARRAEQSPVIDAVLEPGDCLYLPRGFIHSAKALGGVSVHLTFGVHAVREADVMRSILEQVLAQGWRTSMPVGWDPLTADLQPLLAALSERLPTVDLTAVAADLHDRRARSQRPEPLSPIAQAQAASQLQPDDRVRLRRWLGARRTPTGLRLPDGREIEIADQVLTERLMTGHAEQVQNIPGDMNLIAGLLREGVLVIETGP